MNSLFDKEILADKLSKLNSTQQCIETLSHWCIFHRSKAEVVVSTWFDSFRSAEPAHKVPLLYLANDILQNSKRNGNEFVSEFWKFLPAAIKVVNETGDDRGKSVVSRLVGIWQERRVFGSRAQNLKDIMLGGEQPPPLELGKKRSRSIKIMKRDSRSIRTKLSIGGSAEKIVSAFHLVLSDHPGEELAMGNCKSAGSTVRKMELDVDIACAQAKDPKRKLLADNLQDQEKVLKQSVEKLKNFEANRSALVHQLKDVLQEQESELESIRTQIQVAEALTEEASDMRKRLTDENYIASSKPSVRVNSNGSVREKTAADIAAEVADKLTASSSSQLIMSSVLSTFAAEEAKNGRLTSGSTSVTKPQTPGPVNSAPNSLPKMDQSQPVLVTDANFHIPASPVAPPPPTSTHTFQVVHQPSMPSPSLMVHPQTPYQLPSFNGLGPASMQSASPTIQSPYQFPPNTPSQQYGQIANGMNNAYSFGGLPPLPLPGPLPLMPPQNQTHNMGPSVAPPSQSAMQVGPPQHQVAPLIGQPSPGLQSNFQPLQPPGMVFYQQPYSQ